MEREDVGLHPLVVCLQDLDLVMRDGEVVKTMAELDGHLTNVARVRVEVSVALPICKGSCSVVIDIAEGGRS